MDLASRELQQGLEAKKKNNNTAEVTIRVEHVIVNNRFWWWQKHFIQAVLGIVITDGGFDNLSGSHHFSFKRPSAVRNLDVVNCSLTR